MKSAAKQWLEYTKPSRVGEDILKWCLSEADLHSQLDHPNIVRFVGVYFTSADALPGLVMEALPTDLFNYLNHHGAPSNEVTYSILRDVALGLQYLHNRPEPIMHRNLTAGAVLLTDDLHAKIGGFTVARTLPSVAAGQPKAMTQCPGALCYMPPEVLHNQPHYGTEIDIYSFGAVILHISTGECPYLDVLSPTMEDHGCRQHYFDQMGPNHPLSSLAIDCLSTNQPTVTQILHRLHTIILGLKNSQRLFEEAMKHGYVDAKLTLLLLIGAAGAGKTSAKNLFLGLPPPPVRQSTRLAEEAVRAVSTLRARVTGGSTFVWDLVTLEGLEKLIAEAVKTGLLQEHSVPPLQQPAGASEPARSTRSSDVTAQPSMLREHGQEVNVPDLAQETPPVAVRSKSQVEQNILQLIESSPESKKLFDVSWVFVVDSGGQPSFREIVSLFLRNASAVCFVTKLNEQLCERPTVEWYDKDGKRHSASTSHLTNQEILRHSIQGMCSRQSVAGGTRPKILVVGTHKDLESMCMESRAEKNAALLDVFRHNKEVLVYNNVVGTEELIFPVNAKNPTGKDKKVAEQFRRAVSKCSETVKLPIPWFILDSYLHQLADTLCRKILRTSECEEEAEKLHMSPTACESALVYLDKTNMLFYCPEYLKGRVFCGAQVLLDKISELSECIFMLCGASGPSKLTRDSTTPDSDVATPDKDTSNTGHALPDLTEFCDHEGINFRNYAIITINILKKFPSHYVEGLFTPSDFLKLLMAFLVAAPVSEGSNEYIMPCLLREMPLQELDKHRQHNPFSPASPLLIQFTDDWVPAGIFVVLITYLHRTAGWKLRFMSGKPYCLHRNCVTFRLPTGHGGFVTLIDAFDYLEVHIHNASNRTCQKACRRIRDDIFDGVKVSASRLHYGVLLIQPAFLCPTPSPPCRLEHHMANVVDDELVCSISGMKTGELSDRHKVWPLTGRKDKPHADTLTTGSFSVVYRALYDARLKWSVLGTELGLTRTEVVNIEAENTGPDCNAKCLRIMLDIWLRRRTLAPSWKKLVTALKSETVGEESVACNIEQNFIHTL